MRQFTISIFIVCGILMQTAQAALRVDITQGNIEPLPLAIGTFEGAGEGLQSIAAQISEVVKNDLQSCGLFRAIDRASFLEKPSVLKTPEYSSWRKLQAAGVIAGRVEGSPSAMKVEFRMWDPYSETLVGGMVFRAADQGWRRIAHKIADQIYKQVTKEEGFFDTRILLIAENGPAKKRVKRLAIMDQDGANYRVLTNGRSLALSPWFDLKHQRAVYVSYQQHIPKVFLLDINSGRQSVVGNIKGMSFAPRISPDGNYVVMSVAAKGTTNLYEVDLSSGFTNQLTNDPGVISTSPAYSPDGQHIVFNSDRGGSRQIYAMDRDGAGIKRISHGAGVYATPIWSPRGDYIAFTKIRDGMFHLGVMRPDGSGERIITSDWLIERPSWAPNGMALIYSKQRRGGPKQLYAIDITGYHERMVPTPTEATDPAWSPLLG